MPDHDRIEFNERVSLTISVDAPLLDVLQRLAAGPSAHFLALRAQAISAHLIAVTTELQKLSKPNPGE